MIIRPEQVAFLAQASKQRFVDQMVSKLSAHFPKRTSRLGEPRLRELIEYGIGRAREYGIVRQRDVGRYLTLMMMFGPNFDQNKSSADLYGALRDTRLKTSEARTNTLCKFALMRLQSTAMATQRKPDW
jgi:hypothetical protein